MSEESIEPVAEEPKAAKRATKKAPAKRATKKTTAKKAASTTTKKATKKTATKRVARKKAEPAAPAPADDLFPPAPEAASVASESAKKTVRRTKKPTAEVAPSETPAPAPVVAVEAPVEKPAPVPEPTPKPATTPPAEAPVSASAAETVVETPAPAPREHGDSPRPEPSREERGDRHDGRDGEGGYERRGRNRRKRWKDRKRERRREMGPRGGDEREIEDRQPEVDLGPPEPADGILELSTKGYGFLRRRDLKFAQHPQDAFVPADMIRELGLREGVRITGEQCKGKRGPQLTKVTEINERHPDEMREVPLFEELKAVNPNKKIQLETTPTRLTTRVIDMVTPVGRGQRGLIVAPPRAGKTTLLQHIAEAMVENHPQMHLMILLVDERPEEVTEFKRLLPQAEIFASSNDMDVQSHLRIAQFAVERAKRLVEMGEHVFMLMDSITRMARAFNNASKKGATMSGGVGVGALEIPRRLFAAARNTRTAGSLTILATALVETGSRMDELIFQEFKGTGNLELVLDRRIAEQFFYPAVDIFKSGTRREELLLQSFQLEKIRMLRRGLAGHKPIEAIQRVITLLERYSNNAQMLVELPSK